VRRSRTEIPQPLGTRLDDLGVVGEPEVVVAAEAEALAPPADPDRRPHRAFEHLERLPDSLLAEIVEEAVGAGVEDGGRSGHGAVLVVRRRHSTAVNLPDITPTV
jgi:hypothetical protein